jgi:hypothetical protein
MFHGFASLDVGDVPPLCMMILCIADMNQFVNMTRISIIDLVCSSTIDVRGRILGRIYRVLEVRYAVSRC